MRAANGNGRAERYNDVCRAPDAHRVAFIASTESLDPEHMHIDAGKWRYESSMLLEGMGRCENVVQTLPHNLLDSPRHSQTGSSVESPAALSSGM